MVQQCQIVSAQPGLIPQMAGFLTNERLWGTTTFVDHVSDFVYVHLMKNNFTLEETLKAKRAYEKLLHDANILPSVTVLTMVDLQIVAFIRILLIMIKQSTSAVLVRIIRMA